MSPVDICLLERWRTARDAEAFSELVARYGRLVYATARRILGNTTDAEDVTQECFARLAAADTPIRSSLAGWLHILATHRALDRIRSESRRRAREAEHAAATATDDAGRAAMLALVDEAIAALPDESRELVVEHFLMGKTHAEIAESLGVARSTITVRIERGVERIREHVSRQGAGVVTVAVLAELAHETAQALPASVAAALGKLALLGEPATTITATTGAGSMISATALKTMLAATLVIGVAVGVWKYRQPEALRPPAMTAASVRVAQEMQVSAAKDAGARNVTAPNRAAAPNGSSNSGMTANARTTADEAITSATRPYLPAATESVLMGFVLDRDTGAAIPGARIMHWRRDEVAGFADAHGIFRIYAGPGAKSRFIVSGGSYVPETFEVDLQAGQEVRRDFHLEPGGDVDVNVVDSDGQPIEGAVINAEREGYVPDYANGCEKESLTDTAGQLRVKGISRRNSTAISASKEGYYPSGAGIQASSPLLTLQLRHRHPVVYRAFTGRVTDMNGNPLPRIDVRWDGNGHESTDTTSDGRYRLNVPLSTIPPASGGALSVYGGTWSPVQLCDQLPGTMEQPREVNFQLLPGHWISGIVVDESGNPVQSDAISIRPQIEPPYTRWWPTPDPTGRFHQDGLPGPGEEVGIEVRAGGYSTLEGAFLVDREHRIVLKRAGVIKGQVVNAETEQAVTSFAVSINNANYGGSSEQAWKSVEANDGCFLLPSLDQGVPYRVEVQAVGYERAVVGRPIAVQARPEKSAERLIIRMHKNTSSSTQ